MKRFYRQARAAEGCILLDDRPVRTPARAPLALPSDTLAQAIAAEWNAQGDEIDPRSMPLTGLANAAIDRVAPDPQAFARELSRYAETDLLCYRADGPASLAEAQASRWDPPLGWARARYDVCFAIASGVIPVQQPPATVARLSDAVSARDPFALAGLQLLVTIAGSLVLALAVAEGGLDADRAFDAAHVDELWQAERWGEDDLARAARAARRSDWLAAARFLSLL